jgi:hypothetical protein
MKNGEICVLKYWLGSVLIHTFDFVEKSLKRNSYYKDLSIPLRYSREDGRLDSTREDSGVSSVKKTFEASSVFND